MSFPEKWFLLPPKASLRWDSFLRVADEGKCNYHFDLFVNFNVILNIPPFDHSINLSSW